MRKRERERNREREREREREGDNGLMRLRGWSIEIQSRLDRLCYALTIWTSALRFEALLS